MVAGRDLGSEAIVIHAAAELIVEALPDALEPLLAVLELREHQGDLGQPPSSTTCQLPGRSRPLMR